MEKVTFQNSKGLKLVGVFHIPEKETKSIIIIVHAFTSNKDRPGIIKATEEFCKAGFAIFRFDFSGCGESEEDSITIENQVPDLKAAIDFVEQKGYTNIGLLGLSLGGLYSLMCYNDKIKTMVLWSPVTKAKVPKSLEGEEIEAELNEKGYIFLEKHGRKMKVEKQFLTERLNVNQEEILSKVKCPVLIFHGNKDDDVPIEHSQSAMNFLPEGSKLEVVDNAGHNFKEKISEVIPISLDWFKKHL